MLAGGADIWVTKDEFRFGYKMLKGNFDVSVQILSLGSIRKANQRWILRKKIMFVE